MHHNVPNQDNALYNILYIIQYTIKFTSQGTIWDNTIHYNGRTDSINIYILRKFYKTINLYKTKSINIELNIIHAYKR